MRVDASTSRAVGCLVSACRVLRNLSALAILPSVFSRCGSTSGTERSGERTALEHQVGAERVVRSR